MSDQEKPMPELESEGSGVTEDKVEFDETGGTLNKEAPTETTTEDKPVLNPVVLDGRVVFFPKDGIMPAPYNTTNLSQINFTGENLVKTLPNLDSDPTEGLAAYIAGYTHNIDMANYRSDLNLPKNLIRYTDSDGTKRATAITIPQPPLGNSPLSGEDAVLAITSTLGISGRIQGPLAGSGFRIELEAATGDDYTLLDEYLLRRKGEVGRITFGASMAYSTVYLETDIVNLIRRKITNHNIEGVALAEAYRYIKQDDYPTLCTMLMAAAMPDGYEVNVPCLSDDKSCTHTETGVVNPARMYFVDQTLLTDKQLDIITRPMSEKVTLDELKIYEDEFVVNARHPGKYSYDLAHPRLGDITVNFKYKRPTIMDFISGGNVWATGINEIITSALKANDNDDPVVHRRTLKRQISLNSIAQFAAWFDRIEILRDGKVLATVNEAQHIISTLKGIISDEHTSLVFDDVNNYIFDGNPTVIGVPNFPCPKCQSKEPAGVYVIPVDVEMLFFIRMCDQAVLSALVANTGMVM